MIKCVCQNPKINKPKYCFRKLIITGYPIYIKIIDVLGVSDIAVLNNVIPNDELLERAKLYSELLPLLRKVPKSVLKNFIDLAKE